MPSFIILTEHEYGSQVLLNADAIHSAVPWEVKSEGKKN